MTWGHGLLALFDDLEQQAEGLHLAERAAEVGELSRVEYAEVTLAARVHGSLGRRVRIELLGGRLVAGALERAGSDWMLVRDRTDASWLVSLEAIAGAGGLTGRAIVEEARGLTARLSLRSALRRVADDQREVVVHRRDGSTVDGVLGRVGRDFVEVRSLAQGTGRDATAEWASLTPYAAVSAIQERR